MTLHSCGTSSSRRTVHGRDSATVDVDKAAGLVKNARVTVVSPRENSVVVCLHRTDGPSTTHTIGRARFTFGLKRNSPLKIIRTQLPLVHAWALTVNRSQGQTLSCVLLDLRSPAFAHGQAYTAVSRVHSADELIVFVSDASAVTAADGSRVPILASVLYDELLAEPCSIAHDVDDFAGDEAPPPPRPPTSAFGTTPQPRRRRRIMSELLGRLDSAGGGAPARAQLDDVELCAYRASAQARKRARFSA